MKKHKLVLAFLLASIICTVSVHAQIGNQIVVGHAASKWSYPGIGGKFGTGFEVGYGVYKKFSEKMEWIGNLTFVSSIASKNIGYRIVEDPILLEKVYEPSNFDFKVGNVNFNYMIDYKLYKEYLGLVGGLGFQINLNSGKNEEALKDVFMSEEDITGKRPDQVGAIYGTPKANRFTYSASFGISVMPIEQIQIFALMSYPINSTYSSFGIGSNPIFEEIKVLTLRTGIYYKILGSPRDRRY
jgi:hypothetical protein